MEPRGDDRESRLRLLVREHGDPVRDLVLESRRHNHRGGLRTLQG